LLFLQQIKKEKALCAMNYVRLMRLNGLQSPESYNFMSLDCGLVSFFSWIIYDLWKKCLVLPSFLEKIYNFISDEKNVPTQPPQENQQARL